MAAGAAGIVGQLRILVDADTSKAQAALRKLGGTAGVLGGAIGTGLGLAGVAALKMGSAYDEAYDSIRIGTGATGDALTALQDDLKAVAGRVTDDFGLVGQVLADLNTRTGQTGDSLRELTESVLDLSRMTGGSAVENVALLTRLYGDWSIAAEDQLAVNDQLMRVSQATGASISALASDVVNFGAPLRGLGIDFEHAISYLGKWEKEGVNVSTVLTGMRFAVKTFAAQGLDPTKAFPEFIENLKQMDEATGLLTAKQIVGGRAFNDFYRAAVEGRFDVDGLIDTMVNGADTVQILADQTRDAGDAFKEMGNMITGAVGNITMPLAGIAESMGNAIFLVPAMAGALGNSLGRMWTKAGGTAAVKGAIAAAGAAAGLIYEGAIIVGQKLVSIIGAAWVALGRPGSSVMLKATLAGSMASGSFLAGLAKGLTVVGIAAIVGEAVNEGLRQAGVEPKSWTEVAKGMELSLEDAITKWDLTPADIAKDAERMGELFGEETVEAYLDGVNKSYDVLSSAPGLTSQIDLSGTDVVPPDIAGPIRQEFQVATAEIAKGFGAIKDAIANPPQMISKSDRLENMHKRLRIIMRNMRKSVKSEDPWLPQYWEDARAKQQRAIDRLKGKHVTSLKDIKTAYRKTGADVSGKWRRVQVDTVRSAETGADGVVAAAAGALSGIDALDGTTSGYNIGAEVATGMASSLPLVQAQADAMAAAIADDLEAQSPPRKGPLSSIDKWGKPLVDTWLGGIEAQRNRVAAVGATLAGSFAPRPAFAALGAAGAGRYGGEVHYHVGTLIADDKGIDALDKRIARRRRMRDRGPMRYSDHQRDD